jgi:hypothetical protein
MEIAILKQCYALVLFPTSNVGGEVTLNSSIADTVEKTSRVKSKEVFYHPSSSASIE